ncbi:MAG: ABC transporter ATP-binding protein [Lautropia sp.]
MLQVERLDVHYGDAQALQGVDLHVDEGEIVAIVGANGAGKTSLIRAVSGILSPTSGAIRFDRQEIAGWPSHRVCNLGLAQVAEGRQIFPSLSVRDNLDIGAMLPRARASARCTLDRVLTLFPRLAERRDQHAGTLSGGEQQMLAIGRCLMGAPRLIMFDEPSLGLAPAVVADVLRIIDQLNRDDGMTVLLVEQNVAASLRLAARAYVLENGAIVLEGTGPDLLRHPRVRAAYLGL